MHITFLFAFSSRYAKNRTSNFHKVMRQHTEGMVEVLYGFCWKFTSLSSCGSYRCKYGVLLFLEQCTHTHNIAVFQKDIQFCFTMTPRYARFIT